MIGTLLRKIVGSKNERELKRLQPLVEKINSLEPQISALSDAALAGKTAEFQVLQRVSSEMNSTLDLDEIYDVALRTMGELFEFHHANILLLEPGGDTLKVVASRGYVQAGAIPSSALLPPLENAEVYGFTAAT